MSGFSPIGGGGLGVAPGETDVKLTDKLRSLRFKDKEREVKAKATNLGLPYFNLEGFPINPESVAIIPEEEAKSLGLICFWFSVGDIRLGSINPSSIAVKQKIQALTEEYHDQPRLYLISLESLRIGLEAYSRVPKQYKSFKGVHIYEKDLDKHLGSISGIKDLEQMLVNVNITEAVNAMVAGALKTRASDIHIEAGEKQIAIRYRIDGVLYPAASIRSELYQKIVSRLKLLSGLKINVSNKPQDGHFVVNLSSGDIDVRVSSLPTTFGESIVMRLLRTTEKGVSFEDLGLVGNAYEALTEQIKKPNGMILSTGPTGSGKTTTLYAIMVKLSHPDVMIITLEDPIEYRLAGINQSQVDIEHGYTFATGLRSILRQDPNIILIGEIRDFETADIATNAALTGHLVLSTLHTNNAAASVPRLLNIGLKRFLIPPALNAVIGQRLVRRVCINCKKITEPDKKIMEKVKQALSLLPEKTKKSLPKDWIFYKGQGCDICQGLGYVGQIGLFEVMVMSKSISKAILEEEVSEEKIKSLACEEGMVTMFQDGLIKALQGITTLDEVFRVAKEELS